MLEIKKTDKLKRTLVVLHREATYSIMAHASMRWSILINELFYLTQKTNYAIALLKENHTSIINTEHGYFNSQYTEYVVVHNVLL